MAQQKRKDVAVRKDKDRLLLDFYYQNVRCREYLKVQATKDAHRYAERQAKLLEQEVLDGQFNYADWFPDSKKCKIFNSKPNHSNISFTEIAKEWQTSIERKLKVGELKYSTVKSYKCGLKSNVYFFSEYEIRQISKNMIDEYKYSLIDTGLSKKSINNKLTPLRQIFEFAYENAYIDHNEMDRVRNFSVDLPEIEPFNQMEVNAILTYLKNNDIKSYAMFVILFHTGMRIGEVLAMKWKNFDEMFQSYHVKEHFTEKRLESPKTKSSRRIVPLTDEAMRALKNHKQYTFLNSEFIFCNKYGEPWVSSENIMRYTWEPMLKKLGIAYRIIYQCRHTHASLSILAGDNLAHIAERMGHKNVGTLITRYAKYVKAVQFQQPKIGSFLSNFDVENQSNNSICQNTVRNKTAPSLTN